MKSFSASATASVVLGAASLVHAITPITVKGNAFFQGDKRFYIRGVDYQPGGAAGAGTAAGFADPIANVQDCKRDVEYFKKLGINTVRVYSVDNAADHDECMSALADAGIYLALDVNTPDYSLNRDDPHSSYNDVYLQNVFATIDTFAQYDNTLLFFSGNEVINTPSNSNCAPYIKAVTRDMKQYIGEQGHRQIPVGYSAADVEENREQTALYLNCGTDDARSDFFAFNDYSWCDPNTFEGSGWSDKVQTYKSYSIPLFLSEFGCVKTARTFQEIPTLYSEQMTSVYSGGLVFEYAEEGDDFGLVKISGNNISPKSDYTDLMSEYQKTPSPSGDGGYHDDDTPSKCPPAGKYWDVKSSLIPAIPEPAKKYMSDGAGTPKGLKGSSQDAGTPSKGYAKPGSGKVTGGSSSSDTPGAAANLNIPELSLLAPAVMGLVVLASTLFGASLL